MLRESSMRKDQRIKGFWNVKTWRPPWQKHLIEQGQNLDWKGLSNVLLRQEKRKTANVDTVFEFY